MNIDVIVNIFVSITFVLVYPFVVFVFIRDVVRDSKFF